MGNHEALASTGNLLHTALEARSALTDVNLLHVLKDIGHPYGLLLQPLLGEGIFGKSFDSAISQQSSIPLYNTKNEIISLGGKSYSNFLHNSALFMCGEGSIPGLDEFSLGILSVGSSIESSVHPPKESLLSSSASSKETFGIIQNSSNTREKNIKTLSNKSFSISKGNLNFGTVSLNLAKYRGSEPFIVNTPQGEPVAEIQPGSPLAFLHLNREKNVLRQMSPLERIQTMIQDMKNIFVLMDSEELLNSLKPEQQAVLTAAQSAVIVGISHLVPLFRRRTGLPFWKLDVLPQAVQQLHRLDSQAVSNQFGGKREVKVEDVEMMIITPQMRQQLVATYA